MTRHAHRGGDSGVVAYHIGAGRIAVDCDVRDGYAQKIRWKRA